MLSLTKTFSQIYADLRGYNLESFKKDLNAGIVTGIIAIPLSLALAIATGVPPIAGLYTAAIAGFIASVFAGSRFSVSGPAAAMVPVLAAIIHQYGIEQLPLIGFMAGIFLIILGSTGLGRLVRYVPMPVTLGFTAGVAISIFTGQINSYLGLSGISARETFLEKMIETAAHLQTTNSATVIVGIIALAILIFVPNIKALSKIPAALIAVIVTTILVYFVPSFHSVKTIEQFYGAIRLGFPPLRPIILSFNPNLIEAAAKVAFLISIESLLCAAAADKMSKTKHLSNVELIAQGIANMVCPLFSGIPATGVIARTGTAIKNGATSRVAGIVHAVLVMLFLLVLAPLGGKIPLTTLSAILFITAWKISEMKEIRAAISKAPKSDVVVLFVTLLVTVFFDLTMAVAIGMFLAMLAIFRKLSTVHIEKIGSSDSYLNSELRQLLKKNKSVLYLNIEGNLSMGSTSSLLEQVHITKDKKVLMIRLREVQNIDMSGLEALEELIEEAKSLDLKVYLSSISRRIEPYIKKFGILHHVDGLFANTDEVIAQFEKL